MSFLKISTIILAVTSFLCARTILVLFDDPEGSNLLIVSVLAAILYLFSLTAYLLPGSVPEYQRVNVAILVQLVLSAGLYLVLS